VAEVRDEELGFSVEGALDPERRTRVVPAELLGIVEAQVRSEGV
jgi:hypothetical protein